jgi:uncharacterized protein YndB with AHSA1/START domain
MVIKNPAALDLPYPLFELIQTMIEIETTVQAPLNKVWNCFTDAKHVIHWNFASDDWHCPAATYDLRVCGQFSATMAAKDGSMSFDLQGEFTEVNPETSLKYTLADGRKVELEFSETASGTKVTERFEPENMNSPELQKQGWSAILQQFKSYTETLKG